MHWAPFVWRRKWILWCRAWRSHSPKHALSGGTERPWSRKEQQTRRSIREWSIDEENQMTVWWQMASLLKEGTMAPEPMAWTQGDKSRRMFSRKDTETVKTSEQSMWRTSARAHKQAKRGQTGVQGNHSMGAGKVAAQLARPAWTSWQKDRKARGEFGPRRSHDLRFTSS